MNNDRPKKKKKRKSIWDMPPVGDARTHMCFNPLTIYSSLGLLAISFSYLIYSCYKKPQPLTKAQRKEIKRIVA